MKLRKQKLKKALRGLYADQQPERMTEFLGQLREREQTKSGFFKISGLAKYSVPAMALLMIGIITGSSYLNYRNAYQPYRQSENIENTENTEYPESTESMEFSETSTTLEYIMDQPESRTTGHRKQILPIQTDRENPEQPENPESSRDSEKIADSDNLSESSGEIIMTTVTEMAEFTESETSPEQMTESDTQSEFVSQTETETIPPEQTLTRDDIRILLETEPHFSELSEIYDLYFDSIGDSIMNDLLPARSRIMPDFVFYFEDSQGILDSVKAPVSVILPEMADHPLSDLWDILDGIFLIEGESTSWAEDDSLRYTFYTSRNSHVLSEEMNIRLQKAGKHNFPDGETIFYFIDLLQTQYFSLYHPEIGNYYDSMTEQDYQKIENLFAFMKRYISPENPYYQEWLTAGTYSVKASHQVQDSHEIALLYLEYFNYCYLIDAISNELYELRQQLPAEESVRIEEFNKNWSEQEAYFLEQVIPGEWDESRPEVVCFETESAKCRSLLLLIYLQNLQAMT